MNRPELHAALDALIRTDPDVHPGAELVVTNPDGSEAFRAPLARMWRAEPDSNVIWIRPVLGGHQEYPGGPWRFPLADVRRRNLNYTDVTISDNEVVFELVNDQRARLRPTRPDLQPQLEHWDTFVLTVLPADIEAALTELAEDSWHGPWA